MSGLGSRPEIGALNKPKAPFRKEFIDDPQTFALASTTSRAHGLGETPKLIAIKLTCTNTASSYTTGDELMISAAGHSYGGSQGGGVAVEIDSTNIQLHWASNLMVVRKDTYSDQNFLVAADWTVTISAWA